jgi:hypothetical protein
MPILGSVMLIVGLHYVGLDVIHELILGEALPPLPHMQRSQIAQHPISVNSVRGHSRTTSWEIYVLRGSC